MAVVMSNAAGGTLTMKIGKEHAGQSFHDALGNCPEKVVIDADGNAVFRTEGGNVSVWVGAGPFEDLVVNE